jgi:ornithine carbamoyltransferase
VSVRHLLTVDALEPDELLGLLDLADELKARRVPRQDLAGRAVGLLLELPSTRTRVSFEVAVAELGGTAVVLDAAQLQLGREETIEDTARVLSGYLHALVVRTTAQSRLEALAAAGTIPVVNALSDFGHPCQVLADLQTMRERRGRLEGLRLAYVGDGNNIAHSLLRGGAMTGMHVAVASPAGYGPIPQVVGIAEEHAARAGGSVTITDDPLEAVRDADIVYTDVWASMGQEGERAARTLIFRPYQVGPHLMSVARPDAIVLHCLPAHRDEEITADVLDGPQSAVWDQAANRLHAQKALLLRLLGGAEHQLGTRLDATSAGA